MATHSMTSAHRSRLMKRPTIRLKLKRAAERDTNKDRRERGLSKYLRKTGSEARPTKGYNVYKADETTVELETLQKYNTQYDLLDIKFVFENGFISPEEFLENFSHLNLKGSPINQITHIYNYFAEDFYKAMNQCLYDKGIIIDPLDPMENPGYYETTVTTNIARTADVGEYRKKKKEKEKTLLIKKYVKEIYCEAMKLDSEDAENKAFLQEMKELNSKSIYTKEETEAILDFMYDMTLEEARIRPRDMIWTVDNKVLTVISLTRSKQIYAYDPAADRSYFVAPSRIVGVVGTLNEASLEGDIGAQFLRNVLDNKITNKEELNTFLFTTGMKEKELKRALLVYFVDFDVSTSQAEKALILLSKEQGHIFVKDLDIFAAEVMQQNDDLAEEKEVVLWIAKAVLNRSSKGKEVLRKLFSPKVFWTILVGTFVFLKEAGFLPGLIRKLFKKEEIIKEPSRLIPKAIKNRIKVGGSAVSDRTIDTFLKELVGTFVKPSEIGGIFRRGRGIFASVEFEDRGYLIERVPLTEAKRKGRPGPKAPDISKEALLKALARAGGRKSDTAKILGVSPQHVVDLRMKYDLGKGTRGRKKSWKKVLRAGDLVGDWDDAVGDTHRLVGKMKLGPKAKAVEHLLGVIRKDEEALHGANFLVLAASTTAALTTLFKGAEAIREFIPHLRRIARKWIKVIKGARREEQISKMNVEAVRRTFNRPLGKSDLETYLSEFQRYWFDPKHLEKYSGIEKHIDPKALQKWAEEEAAHAAREQEKRIELEKAFGKQEDKLKDVRKKYRAQTAKLKEKGKKKK